MKILFFLHSCGLQVVDHGSHAQLLCSRTVSQFVFSWASCHEPSCRKSQEAFANLMSIYNFFMMNVIFCCLYNTCSKWISLPANLPFLHPLYLKPGFRTNLSFGYVVRKPAPLHCVALPDPVCSLARHRSRASSSHHFIDDEIIYMISISNYFVSIVWSEMFVS